MCPHSGKCGGDGGGTFSGICMAVKQPVPNINSQNTMHGESAKTIIEESENQLPEKKSQSWKPMTKQLQPPYH